MTMKYLLHKLYQRLVKSVINNDAYNLTDYIHVHVELLLIKNRKSEFILLVIAIGGTCMFILVDDTVDHILL